METIKVDIINPKAKRILEELADLNLIHIQKKDSLKSFDSLLKKLRSNKKPISLKEITAEVETVRTKRHGKKG
jgi:uncharacterized membrane protein YukC